MFQTKETIRLAILKSIEAPKIFSGVISVSLEPTYLFQTKEAIRSATPGATDADGAGPDQRWNRQFARGLGPQPGGVVSIFHSL
ncbi:hypothetical protein J6590_070770 [Homalodisca vitripennis]|nr:hypothetical protein J6590_070770 [Homalodisca vitripennis]